MKKVQLYKDGESLLSVGLANRYFLRLRGLLGRNVRDLGGLWIVPCAQIHTFMMKEEIDVAYIDKEGWVIHTDACLKTGKAFPFVKNSRAVLELPAGDLERFVIKEGTKLKVL